MAATQEKVAALTDALESAQQQVNDLEAKCAARERSDSKDESFRVAESPSEREEAEKLAAKSMNGERKLTDLNSELERVKSDLAEYRDTVLSTRRKRSSEGTAGTPHGASKTLHRPRARIHARLRSARRGRTSTDRRVACLQEQLENERAQKDDIKARALRAERAIRDAGKKRASDAGKLDAKLRETEHA